MSDLKGALGEAVAAAFAAAGLAAELGRVTPRTGPTWPTSSRNGALAAAKAAEGAIRARSPTEVVARLGGDPRLASVEIAGPGLHQPEGQPTRP